VKFEIEQAHTMNTGMPGAGSFDLLHVVGFLTGAVLYGMLIVMVARPPAPADRFALSTGLLGLVWNVGELAAYAARLTGLALSITWIHAFSFTALGLLASVVVHSVARAPVRFTSKPHIVGSAVAVVVYACATFAGVMHLIAAASAQTLPSALGLTVLTIGLLAVIPALITAARRQLNGPRALWMAALAVVAVSALHLGRIHGAQESWPVELIGHHASIVLAFAILYQDYRFALADLFLKQALTLLVLVVLVFSAFSMVEPLLTAVDGRLQPSAIALLLALWTGTALLFPACRRAVAQFVDRVVLRRAGYRSLVQRLSDDVQQCGSPDAVLDGGCDVVAASLTATSVKWEMRRLQRPGDLTSREIAIWTAEPPHYVLVIGQLAGGRRLLSDDLAMLERVAFVLARRIDALRLTEERYERMLQEREMRTLATEAELRALRAQINPHFLFNALTTIGYLIQQAPAHAVKTLLDLTTLLRSVLRSEGEFTTLGRERELIDCYLRIERERFEDRLEFTLKIPEELCRLVVPSLIVQPLVENAVKHGIAGARDGGTVSVTATADADLRIVVRNTGAPLGTRGAAGPGVGLENVTRRLEHYYGVDASLTVCSDAEGATVAELRLPATDGEDRRADLMARNATT
jgi:two-component system LytT family sensor kinase